MMRLIEVRAQNSMDMNFCHLWTVNDFKAFLSFHSHSRFSNAVLASLESKSYWRRMSKNKAKKNYKKKKKDQKSSPLEKWRWKRYTKKKVDGPYVSCSNMTSCDDPKKSSIIPSIP